MLRLILTIAAFALIGIDLYEEPQECQTIKRVQSYAGTTYTHKRCGNRIVYDPQ